jgi:hypothetical protein
MVPERGQSQAFSESNDERLAENDTTGAERMLLPGLLPLQCRPKMKMPAFTKVEMSSFSVRQPIPQKSNFPSAKRGGSYAAAIRPCEAVPSR